MGAWTAEFKEGSFVYNYYVMTGSHIAHPVRDPASINKNLVFFKVKCKKRLVRLKMCISSAPLERISVAKSSDFLGLRGRAGSLSSIKSHPPTKKKITQVRATRKYTFYLIRKVLNVHFHLPFRGPTLTLKMHMFPLLSRELKILGKRQSFHLLLHFKVIVLEDMELMGNW